MSDSPAYPVVAPAPKVEFNGDVLRQIRRHARSSMSAEICGVLIGTAGDDFTRVTACIAGEGASQGGAHVTFTQDTWAHIYKIKDADFPSQSIVGWYHSHPGFGIFLSDYDLFIHENFFTARHQVAWVFDPHSDEEGCFGWIDQKVESIEEVAVIRKHRSPAPEQTLREGANHQAASPPNSVGTAPQHEENREAAAQSRWFDWILLLVLLAFCVGVAWWLTPRMLTFAKHRHPAGPPAFATPDSASPLHKARREPPLQVPPEKFSSPGPSTLQVPKALLGGTPTSAATSPRSDPTTAAPLPSTSLPNVPAASVSPAPPPNAGPPPAAPKL